MFDGFISYYITNFFHIFPVSTVGFQNKIFSNVFIFILSICKEMSCIVICNVWQVHKQPDSSISHEWIKNQIRNTPKPYKEIQPNWTKALVATRKGDKIPELNTILEENFIKNEDDTWRIPNIQDDVDLEKLRTKALLKEFKLYMEVCRKPRGKLKDVRVEAVRAGFKQCYIEKNFADIILVGDRIPQNLLTEDEVLLQYYDIASSKV